jgi:hypothetical protein
MRFGCVHFIDLGICDNINSSRHSKNVNIKMQTNPKHIHGQSITQKATKTSEVIFTITKELLKSQRNTCRGNWHLIFFVVLLSTKASKNILCIK